MDEVRRPGAGGGLAVVQVSDQQVVDPVAVHVPGGQRHARVVLPPLAEDLRVCQGEDDVAREVAPLVPAVAILVHTVLAPRTDDDVVVPVAGGHRPAAALSVHRRA